MTQQRFLPGSRPPRGFLLICLAAFIWVACAPRTDPAPQVDPTDWEEIRREAQGQTVQWWMFGGDERVNRYVDQHLVPAAAELGVKLERVPVADTADAVQRVLAELRASTESGGSDLIWINGENFAFGKDAGLWLQDWATELPNAANVDWDDAAINHDFGVPVDGQESPWSRAAFVLAYNPARTPTPPRTFQALFEYARENPGRVTYPAPPDFTGSAFVRLAVQTLGEEEAFGLLKRLIPFLWRQGATYPGSEAELNRLFGNDEVDFAMSYNPGFVAAEVHRGTFAASTRPFIMSTGTLHNVSYVTIPTTASSQAGAMVVANLLLEPRFQALQSDPEVLGAPSVLSIERLPPDLRARISEASVESPHILSGLDPVILELRPERVTELEERWRREVLR